MIKVDKNSPEYFMSRELPIKISLYKQYINRHHKKFKEPPVSFEEFRKLIEGNCYYCGVPPLKMEKDDRNLKNNCYTFVNGVDRIDSSKGYSNGNVRSCCITCNRAKNDYTEKEFYNKIDQSYNHLKLRGLIK